MTLSDSQISQIRQAFNLYDTCGANAITVEQMATVMRSLGKCPSQADVREIAQQYGIADSVDFPTLVHIMENSVDKYNTTEHDIAEAFSVFDKERTGFVAAEEIMHVLSVLGETMSKEEINNIIGDHVQDGMIEYRSFAKVLTPTISVS